MNDELNITYLVNHPELVPVIKWGHRVKPLHFTL